MTFIKCLYVGFSNNITKNKLYELIEENDYFYYVIDDDNEKCEFLKRKFEKQ